jgi:hypothetical protein
MVSTAPLSSYAPGRMQRQRRCRRDGRASPRPARRSSFNRLQGSPNGVAQRLASQSHTAQVSSPCAATPGLEARRSALIAYLSPSPDFRQRGQRHIVTPSGRRFTTGGLPLYPRDAPSSCKCQPSSTRV